MRAGASSHHAALGRRAGPRGERRQRRRERADAAHRHREEHGVEADGPVDAHRGHRQAGLDDDREDVALQAIDHQPRARAGERPADAGEHDALQQDLPHDSRAGRAKREADGEVARAAGDAGVVDARQVRAGDERHQRKGREQGEDERGQLGPLPDERRPRQDEGRGSRRGGRFERRQAPDDTRHRIRGRGRRDPAAQESADDVAVVERADQRFVGFCEHPEVGRDRLEAGDRRYRDAGDCEEGVVDTDHLPDHVGTVGCKTAPPGVAQDDPGRLIAACERGGKASDGKAGLHQREVLAGGDGAHRRQRLPAARRHYGRPPFGHGVGLVEHGRGPFDDAEGVGGRPGRVHAAGGIAPGNLHVIRGPRNREGLPEVAVQERGQRGVGRQRGSQPSQ